jgi:protein-S-isoprenylcysteine O-methyltransferase Ste14
VTSVIAWAGGALFAASLSYAVYFYVWVLGDPTPVAARPVWAAALLNFGLFGGFALHHSLFARDPIKRWLVRVIPARIERSSYVWSASLLLLAVLLSWQLVEGMVYRIDGGARWLLYGVQLAGAHLTMRAAGAIDALTLAGIRQAVRQTRPVDFRTDGPFALVRHPIYLGWILIAFGAPTMTVNRMMFAAISSLYLIVAIPWEETSLAAAFGERYRAYQATVRWRLIPGIW